MRNNWAKLTLGDLGQVITGKTPSTRVLSNFGGQIPFVTPRDLDGSRIVSRTERYLSETGAQSVKNTVLPPKSVMVSCIGSDMGKAAIAEKQCVTNQQINSIIVDDQFDYKYVYYNLSTRKDEIRGRAGGSAQPILNKSHFSQLDILMPGLTEQQAIAHILGSLDDKIELNRRMNETLEAMAQAMFKSWFVDFDQVIDNALAAGNEIPEELKEKAAIRESLGNARKPLPEEIQNLFPSEFEHTEELGWIPKGWKVGALSQHAIIEMGQSPKGETYNGAGIGTPLVNGPVEFGNYFANKTKWTTSPTKLSSKGDLIVCVRGSTTGRFVKSDDIYCLGRGVCSVRGIRSQCFVDQMFKLSIDKMLGLTTGSTFPNWSRQTLSEFKTIIPTELIIDKYDKYISPKIEKLESGVLESEYLSNLRDTLLPKLLSGEIRIPEAEKLLKDLDSNGGGNGES